MHIQHVKKLIYRMIDLIEVDFACVRKLEMIIIWISNEISFKINLKQFWNNTICAILLCDSITCLDFVSFLTCYNKNWFLPEKSIIKNK